MRTALMLVVAGVLLTPSAVGAASWTGTWENAGVGTRGAARLAGGTAATLQLDGIAFGCAVPVTVAVRIASGRVSGAGRDVACNHGLRWQVSGAVSAPVIQLRLPDGSESKLRLSLRRGR